MYKMEFRTAKRKKFKRIVKEGKFTLCQQRIKARFSGKDCCVTVPEDMRVLFSMGYYGKGNLSKSEPVFNHHDGTPELILEQQYENRRSLKYEVNDGEDESYKLANDSLAAFLQTACQAENRRSPRNFSTKPSHPNSYLGSFLLDSLEETSPNMTDPVYKLTEDILRSRKLRSDNRNSDKTVLVVNDEGSRFEECFTPREMLVLDLQETFFLAAVIGNLYVLNREGKEMSIDEMWSAFQEVEESFINRYIVYHWYRSKGWIVRCGLKYGGDFVLYEKCPEYCHSSYVVRVKESGCSLAWEDLSLLQRLVETVKKDILLCYVMIPQRLTEELMSYTDLSECRVAEVVWRRWIPSQQKTN